MAYEFYNAYLASTPSGYYQNTYNAFLDMSFSDASTYKGDGEVEKWNTTSEEWEDVIVRVTEISTLTKKIDGDTYENFRQIIYPDDTTLYLGDKYRYKDNIWLCIDNDSEGYVSRCHIRKCNSEVSIAVRTVRLQTGIDSLGRPIYAEASAYFESECIVSNKLYINSFMTVDKAINLPSGQLIVYVPYDSNNIITEKMTFTMYGNTYEIFDLDYTRVIDSVGLLGLIAQKIVSE
jgi:hypothetical protein